MNDSDKQVLFELICKLKKGEHIYVSYEFREPFIAAIHNLIQENAYLTEENTKLKERNYLLETLGPVEVKAEDELFAKVYAESIAKNEIDMRCVYPGSLNLMIVDQIKQKIHQNALGTAARAVRDFRNR